MAFVYSEWSDSAHEDPLGMLKGLNFEPFPHPYIALAYSVYRIHEFRHYWHKACTNAVALTK
ncbi:hypothetical protein [Priestia megaterium]